MLPKKFGQRHDPLGQAPAGADDERDSRHYRVAGSLDALIKVFARMSLL
ncbi:hypothetical protein [Synechococcus sp. MU1611]|nr:hypothetical protein [Synechococcus sp. MU1611]